MARRKKLSNYSQEYLKLFTVANTRPVTVPCDNQRAAENLRRELYHCRAAIYAEGKEELVRAAQNVRFFVKPNTTSSTAMLVAEPIWTPKESSDEQA